MPIGIAELPEQAQTKLSARLEGPETVHTSAVLDKQLDEALEYGRRGLVLAGIDPVPLEAAASTLTSIDDFAFEPAMAEFSKAAENYYSSSDSDYGALLLEKTAEGCPNPDRRMRLLLAAQSRAATFASWATSGGEGTARMLDVNRLLAKLDNVRRTPT